MDKALRLQIEGPDGSGKSTMFDYLVRWLQNYDQSVLRTCEAGSPLIPVNVKLRNIVLSPEHKLSDESMELIFAAMSVENERYYQAVESNYDFIVSDRGILSHFAYSECEDFTNEVYLKLLKSIYTPPDYIVYLSIDPEVATDRRIKRSLSLDVIESKGESFQRKVMKAYNKCLGNIHLYSPGTEVFIVDANSSIDKVESAMDNVIKELISKKNIDS